MTCFVSYIASTYMVETISIANSMKSRQKVYSLFTEGKYKKVNALKNMKAKDGPFKESAYYIREKVEIGKLSETFTP
jgi:hypothetical protein